MFCSSARYFCRLSIYSFVLSQNVAVSEDDYQRKLEEQKKIRERIKAMKEKKRQEAAESRRKELLRRLIEEGWSLCLLCPYN